MSAKTALAAVYIIQIVYNNSIRQVLCGVTHALLQIKLTVKMLPRRNGVMRESARRTAMRDGRYTLHFTVHILILRRVDALYWVVSGRNVTLLRHSKRFKWKIVQNRSGCANSQLENSAD